MKVIFDQSAYDDLDQIFLWIAADKPDAANSVVGRILTATEHLGRFPSTGHPGRVRNTMEWVVLGLPYTVVYEVHSNLGELLITGVFHHAFEARHT